MRLNHVRVIDGSRCVCGVVGCIFFGSAGPERSGFFQPKPLGSGAGVGESPVGEGRIWAWVCSRVARSSRNSV